MTKHPSGLTPAAVADLRASFNHEGLWEPYQRQRALLGVGSFGRFEAFTKLRRTTSGSTMPHYNDKYMLHAQISESGKLDTVPDYDRRTWHMIWNRLSNTTRWAIVEDVFGQFILVDVPTTMRDDLARTYMGEFTKHETMDAAIMFAMIMRGKKA